MEKIRGVLNGVHPVDKMKKVALITGITGQDGNYLSELLVTKGYKVIGSVRDIKRAEKMIAPELLSAIELVDPDILSQRSIARVLSEYRPGEFYNLAAYSSGSGMYDDPAGIGLVNGLAVTYMLEAIREVDASIRFCQASSREIFGEAIESPQTEHTATDPRSPYGAAKLYADNMIQVYRQQYHIFACSAILYNHESPRRRLEFVTRRITHQAAKIKLGLAEELKIGNLDARRDWGFAKDHVRAMWLMLQQAKADDYIVATGEAHTVRELCETAFAYLDLDYRDYISEDISAFRPDESHKLVGDTEKAKNGLGWMPEVSFEELIKIMVDADMQLLKHVSY